MPDPTFAFVGRRSCGCIVAAFVADPRLLRQIAKDVAEWERDGLKIETMSVEDVRKQLWHCPHQPTQDELPMGGIENEDQRRTE